MKYIFTLLLIFLTFSLYSQINIETPHKCGTMEVHKWRLEHEPGYAIAYQKIQEYTAKFLGEHPNGYSPKAVITIPIVFHEVLSSTEQASFPDSRIDETIQMLNRDYSGQNPHSMYSFPATLKADCEIQFCKATIDPNGNPTNGIEKVIYTGPNWAAGDNGVKQTASGGLDAWDPNQYLNVWVCNLVNGLCGYGTLPGGGLNNFYGLVIDFDYTGHTGAAATLDNGGTAAHEIGHCFNLLHTWGDDEGGSDPWTCATGTCCTGSDAVGDTPDQAVATSGGPTGVVTDACTATSPGINYQNFMDYSYDDVYANFTPGQKTRMLALFQPGQVLEPLANSFKCGTPLVADFVGVPTTVNIGGTVNFTDLTTGSPTAWQWTFTGAATTSSTVQNPTGIQYNTVGLYPVKLKVTKPNFADSITKTAYIEVIDPNAVNADFVGVPTILVAGNTVDFTDLSTNTPTSWQWNFYGGTPATSTVKNPQNILYSAAGVYDVRLRAANTATNDTMRKVGYIIVINPQDVPHADFVGNPNNLPAGSTSDFTNLSGGVYDSVHWYFNGAVPSESTASNPAGVLYNTPGDYDVTLIIFGPYGNDTLVKPNYVHVFAPGFVDSVFADFQATTSRLIVQGWGVNFEDLSTGNITDWQWLFQGGTPATSTIQNPIGIIYNTPGIYDVCLVVRNGAFTDTLCKDDYIVVTTQPWPNPNGFCDTSLNILQSERPLTFMHLIPNKWGYFPGHNQNQTKYYAEKFVNYTISDVSGFLVSVVKAYSSAPANKVRFTVWNMDSLGRPGNVLGYKDELISSFSPYLYNPVHLTQTIPVNGKFFIGFQLWYNNPVDTFLVYMAPNRGVDGQNTLYVKKGSNWITPTQYFNDTMVVNTSMAIKLLGCLIGVEEIDMENQVVVYPNPASDMLNIELYDVVPNNFSCIMYDITGRAIPVEPFEVYSDKMEIDLTKVKSGIYFLQINVNNQKITKKVSVIH